MSNINIQIMNVNIKTLLIKYTKIYKKKRSYLYMFLHKRLNDSRNTYVCKNTYNMINNINNSCVVSNNIL